MATPVEQIKERLTIVDVVSSYMKIDKAGINYKARCPFHNEKTPSFMVSPERNSYYCFGCGAKGDIFSFVEEYEGLTFREALVKLADRAGVKLTTFQKEQKNEDHTLFEIIDAAVQHFEEKLGKNPAVLSYVQKRGMKEETLKEWRIGYALDDWRDLFDHLAKKYRETDIKRAGLIKYSEERKTDRPYDTFRNRIMFPIMDGDARPVAFSGRIFGDDPNAPKYLNSPETEIFKKSEMLYGLHKAKTEIRKKDFAILVEGQFDIVMMHQTGIRNTVATSGTAFTQEHAKKLKKYANRLLIAFDGDEAGVAAALRAGDIALGESMEVKVVAFPEGEDPASMAVSDLEALKKALASSEHLIDFRIGLIDKKARDDREKNKLIKEEILPLIVGLQSDMQQMHFVKRIHERLGIKEQSIIDDIKKIKNQIPAEMVSHELTRFPTEKRLVSIFFWLEADKAHDAVVKEMNDKFAKIYANSDQVIAKYIGEKEAMIFEAEQYYAEEKDMSVIVGELFSYLESEKMRQELADLKGKIAEAEKQKDKKRITELITRSNELSRRIHKIEQV